jgi:hypothetical protein
MLIAQEPVEKLADGKPDDEECRHQEFDQANITHRAHKSAADCGGTTT